MGTLKVNGHIEGNYIKATWLYTSAATAKTSVDKIACIGSDNFIYYITPTNMNVGRASILNKYATKLNTDTDVDAFLGNGMQLTWIGHDITGLKNDGAILSIGQGSGWGAQLWIDDGSGNGGMAVRSRKSTTAWNDWKPVLTSANYTSYTVTKTGSGASGTWGINITGNAGSATYLKDSSNNTATYVNYGASGITSTSWMAAWNGYELRAMSPDYVCASRLYSTDSSYKFSSSNPYYGYLTYNSPYWDFKVYPATPSDVRVSRAYTAGSADSATNADKVDGYHASSFAFQGSHNNLTASGNEFTFASSGFSGPMYVNYRTAGGQNGNISEYIFQNGAGSNAAIQCSGGYMSGGLAIVNHTQNNSYDALLFVSHHSTNEWGVTIDKNGSYDYGLYINCGQGNYGLSLNGGLLLYNGVGYGSSFPSNPATGRVFFKI